MESLYFKKKEQMKSPSRNVIVDASVELQKTRSVSPQVARDIVPILPLQKVAYKSDLECVKSDIQNLSNSVSSLISELKEQVDKMQKNFESVKYESLKNHLNESISQQNENIKNITNELVCHLDKLNVLESQVKTIEDIL